MDMLSSGAESIQKQKTKVFFRGHRFSTKKFFIYEIFFLGEAKIILIRRKKNLTSLQLSEKIPIKLYNCATNEK